MPRNIPNLGGRRPKQSQAVSLQPVVLPAEQPKSRACCYLGLTAVCALQTSMSGISVSEDAINMYYFMKAKSTVGDSAVSCNVTSCVWLAGSADLLAALRSTDGQHG